MLFYDNDNVDAAWEEAKRLYDADRLEGISSMKVSTNYDNPRASRRDNKARRCCHGCEPSRRDFFFGGGGVQIDEACVYSNPANIDITGATPTAMQLPDQ